MGFHPKDYQIVAQILNFVQNDSSLSTEQLAERVNLSKNACWRRVKQLESTGVIKKRVALVDPKAVDLSLQVFVTVSVKEHALDWLDKFEAAMSNLPQITGAFRTTGEIDYLLSVRVKDVEGYDAFYKSFISQVPGMDLSATFVMEEIKNSTALPVVAKVS